MLAGGAAATAGRALSMRPDSTAVATAAPVAAPTTITSKSATTVRSEERGCA
jgi:hypothetical protein